MTKRSRDDYVRLVPPEFRGSRAGVNPAFYRKYRRRVDWLLTETRKCALDELVTQDDWPVRPLVDAALPPGLARPHEYEDVRNAMAFGALRGYALGVFENRDTARRDGLVELSYLLAERLMCPSDDTLLDEIVWYLIRAGYYLARTGEDVDAFATKFRDTLDAYLRIMHGWSPE